MPIRFGARFLWDGENLVKGLNNFPGERRGAPWLARLLVGLLSVCPGLVQGAAGSAPKAPVPATVVPAAPAAPIYKAPEGPDSRLRTLSRISDVRELPPAEAARGYPVKATGIITFAESRGYSQFLQDASGGIYLYVPLSNSFGLRSGQRLEVTGFSGPGDFAPVIHVQSVKLLGTPPTRSTVPSSCLPC